MKKRRRFHDRMPENKSEYGQLIMKHVFENLLISNNVLMWYYRVRFIYKRAQYVSLNNKMSVYFNHYFFFLYNIWKSTSKVWKAKNNNNNNTFI